MATLAQVPRYFDGELASELGIDCRHGLGNDECRKSNVEGNTNDQ
jgi:hypothetical protein